MRQLFGTRVLAPGGRGSARRGGQRLPQRGEKLLWMWFEGLPILMWWKAHQGYRPLAVARVQVPARDDLIQWHLPGEEVAIKRRQQLDTPAVLPFLSSETKVLAKCPNLVEFLSATAYEDGLPRQPGYMTIRNRVIEYEITLYDPDAGQRVAVRARLLDQAFAGAEAVLSATDAPWEPDKYLQERMPKKKKK